MRPANLASVVDAGPSALAFGLRHYQEPCSLTIGRTEIAVRLIGEEQNRVTSREQIAIIVDADFQHALRHCAVKAWAMREMDWYSLG